MGLSEVAETASKEQVRRDVCLYYRGHLGWVSAPKFNSDTTSNT